jgi:Glycosyl transferase family 2
MRNVRKWCTAKIASSLRAASRINKFSPQLMFIRKMILPLRISHLMGPRRVTCDLHDVIVTCVMRNGILHLDSFLRHYRKLGVKHFVFLDTGSTDGSVNRLLNEDKITLLQTSAPYRVYENLMKLFLAETYCLGRWCLTADIDELFDYPYSEVVTFPDFISYLNRENYNAVITQMLDMFSDVPLSKLCSRPEDDLRLKYSYYDLSSITKHKYQYSDVPDRRIMMHSGGIRKRLFGTDNGLTKVSLFLMDGEIKPFFTTWHHVENARIADVSCVLLHFPFVQSFYDKVSEAVVSGRYGYHVNDEYKAYLFGLNNVREQTFKLPTADVFTHVEELIAREFIVVSEKYQNWANSHDQGPRQKNHDALSHTKK